MRRLQLIFIHNEALESYPPGWYDIQWSWIYIGIIVGQVMGSPLPLVRSTVDIVIPSAPQALLHQRYPDFTRSQKREVANNIRSAIAYGGYSKRLYSTFLTYNSTVFVLTLSYPYTFLRCAFIDIMREET